MPRRGLNGVTHRTAAVLLLAVLILLFAVYGFDPQDWMR